jgi:amidase
MIAELQALMTSGEITSRDLVRAHPRRIGRIDERRGLNAMIEVIPDAVDIAPVAKAARTTGGRRAPASGVLTGARAKRAGRGRT